MIPRIPVLVGAAVLAGCALAAPAPARAACMPGGPCIEVTPITPGGGGGSGGSGLSWEEREELRQWRRERKAGKMIEKGNAAIERRQWARAREYYQAAIDSGARGANLSAARTNLSRVGEFERTALVNDLLVQGVAAYKRGDWAAARTAFLKAQTLAPNDSGVRNNINLVNQAEWAEQEQRRKAAEKKQADARQVQQDREARVHSANLDEARKRIEAITRGAAGALERQGGSTLDLEADAGGAAALASAPEPVWGDPMVVDGRGARVYLPPSLPSLEAVARSPGLGWWRRGMEQAMLRDWTAAEAMFKTALQQDPENDALKAAVSLAEWTRAHPGLPPPPPSPAEVAADAEAKAVAEAYNDLWREVLEKGVRSARLRQSGAGGGGAQDEFAALYEAALRERPDRAARAPARLDRRWEAEVMQRAVEDSELRARVRVESAGQVAAVGVEKLFEGDVGTALTLLELAEKQAPENPNYADFRKRVVEAFGDPRPAKP